MSAHVGIQFHAAPSQPLLMTGTSQASMVLTNITKRTQKAQTIHFCTETEQKSTVTCAQMDYDVNYCTT